MIVRQDSAYAPSDGMLSMVQGVDCLTSAFHLDLLTYYIKQNISAVSIYGSQYRYMYITIHTIQCCYYIIDVHAVCSNSSTAGRRYLFTVESGDGNGRIFSFEDNPLVGDEIGVNEKVGK